MEGQVNLFALHRELTKESVKRLLKKYKDNPIMIQKIKIFQEGNGL